MRVNSRPVGPEVEMGENVWLGVGGRLLTFQKETSRAVDEASADAGDSVSGIGNAVPVVSPGD